MGNTNLPQSGAVGHENSRDTQSGAEQLTEAQRRQRRDQAQPGIEIPDSDITADEALGGHVDTGHSPPDAS